MLPNRIGGGRTMLIRGAYPAKPDGMKRNDLRDLERLIDRAVLILFIVVSALIALFLFTIYVWV
jgi:hypothetical protein